VSGRNLYEASPLRAVYRLDPDVIVAAVGDDGFATNCEGGLKCHEEDGYFGQHYRFWYPRCSACVYEVYLDVLVLAGDTGKNNKSVLNRRRRKKDSEALTAWILEADNRWKFDNECVEVRDLSEIKSVMCVGVVEKRTSRTSKRRCVVLMGTSLSLSP
jgi:hypothetical protein